MYIQGSAVEYASPLIGGLSKILEVGHPLAEVMPWPLFIRLHFARAF